MGTNSLPKLAAAPTLVPATTTQYNNIVDSLQGNQVMRDSAGAVEDNVSDIGRPSSGRPNKLYLGTGLNVAGQDIDFSSIALETSGVTSGKSKTSGYPDFLTAEGVTGGATNVVTIEGSVTPLVGTIDGEAFILETDLESSDLTLAPGSNNTALVNDTLFADQILTQTIGEYGYWISIDSIGSEVSDLDGTVQAFKLDNGTTGGTEREEVFLALVDTTNNRLIPIHRGIGGTNRIVFSDNDNITLLKANYIFLDNDLATVDNTVNYPTWSSTEPSAPTAGDYWYDVTNKTWKRYSGSAWEQLGRVYLGYAICDNADCLYVEHEDYNLAWNDLFDIRKIVTWATDTIKMFAPLNVNVAGNKVSINSDYTINTTDNLADDGTTLTLGTWYYIYLDSSGNTYLSDIAPRRKLFQRGYYHPGEYWRCIGLQRTRSTSVTNFIAMVQDKGIIAITEIPTALRVAVTVPAASATNETLTSDICGIVNDVQLSWDFSQTTADIEQEYQAKELDPSGYGVFTQYIVRERQPGLVSGSGNRIVKTDISFVRSGLFQVYSTFTNHPNYIACIYMRIDF